MRRRTPHNQALDVIDGSPLRLARTDALTAYGAFLTRRREPVEARVPLAQALALAEACGGSWHASQARVELRRAGGTSAGGPPDGRSYRRRVPAVPLPPPYAELVAALAEVGRSVVAHGLVVGSGGNLSARHVGADELLVTATGTWLDRLTAASFSVVGLDGTVRAGHPAPTSELPLHLASYRARPDISALIHLHPQASVLLDAVDRPIRLLTTDHVYYVRRVRSVPFLPPGTPELAGAAAAALADGCNCVILRSHGCSVVADSVALAHQRVANLEQAALATYRLLLLGDTATACPAEYAERLAGFDRDPATRGRH